MNIKLAILDSAKLFLRPFVFLMSVICVSLLAGCAKEPTNEEIKNAFNEASATQGSELTRGLIKIDRVEKINNCKKEGEIFDCNITVDTNTMGMKNTTNVTAQLTRNKEGKVLLLAK